MWVSRTRTSYLQVHFEEGGVGEVVEGQRVGGAESRLDLLGLVVAVRKRFASGSLVSLKE